MEPSELEAVLQALGGDAASLARSVRARVQALPGVAERLEPRPGSPAPRADLLFLRAGAELARLQLRPGAALRVLLDGQAESIEIAGLAGAAQAAEKIRALADGRAAREPQLELFGRR